jgi:hypothetical protein
MVVKPKHVGTILVYILMYSEANIYSASVGENKNDFDNIKMYGTTTIKKTNFRMLALLVFWKLWFQISVWWRSADTGL